MSEPFSLTIGNRLSELPRLLDAVEAYIQGEDIADEIVGRVQIAIDELLSNVIRWGYDDDQMHSIYIKLAKESAALNLIIEDDARQFDPTAVPSPDMLVDIRDRPEGGLGIHLVRSMAEISYHRNDGRNIVELKFGIK